MAFVLGLLVAAVCFAAPAASLKIGESKEKVGTIDLPSGMRVVIEEDRSKPVVAVVSVLNVGAADDPPGKEGLAHLVEHLTFRAKPDGKLQRANQLEFAGAFTWNASTTHDLTTYMVAGPSESLRNLLVIEGARLMGPLAGLDQKAFEVERQVVKNELLDFDEQGAPSAVQPQLFAQLYPAGHRYHRPVPGTIASLSQLTLADAQAYVQEHYLPTNVTLYLAGDLDLASIHELLGKTLPEHFVVAPPAGAVKPAVRLAQVAPSLVPVPTALPLVTLVAPVPGPMLFVGWSLPRAFSADSVLERAVRSALETVPVWATANSDIESVRATLIPGRDSSTLVCAVSLRQGSDAAKSLARVFDQLHRFSDPGATVGTKSGEEQAARLDFSSGFGSGGGRYLAAASSLRVEPGEHDMPQSIQTNTGGESSNSTQARKRPDLPTPVEVHVARLEMTAAVSDVVEMESVLGRAVDRATLTHYTGDAEAWDKDMTALTELGPSSWQNFTLQWLSRERARAVLVIPSGASAGTTREDGTPPVFAADDLRVKVMPSALKTYAHGPAGDIQLVTLKNGLQVVLARRLGAPSVAAVIGVRGGSATAEPLGASEAAMVLAHPQPPPEGPPSQFGGSVESRCSLDATYVSGRAASGNLENLLASLSSTIQSYRVEDEVGWSWNGLVDAKRRSQVLPRAVAERSFLQGVYPGSPLGRTALAADFEKIGPRPVQRWLDRTLRPPNAVLALVGDIDILEAERQVREAFAGWQGQRDSSGEARSGQLTEQRGPVRIVAIDRPGAQTTEIRLGCSIGAPSQTGVIAMGMLGGRLRTRLSTLARGTLGGSIGFRGGADFYRQAARLDVAGSVDGRSLIAVLGFAREELVGLETFKPTEEEVGLLRWRQGIAWNGRFTANVELAQEMAWTRLAGLPLELLQGDVGLLSAVTADDLTRIAAECRKTAVLMVSGDPTVVDKALLATESSMLLRQGT